MYILKEKFKTATLIAIINRLNLVAYYDKVIIFKKGQIIEEGAPWRLLDQRGKFFEMVQNTGKNAKIITNQIRKFYKGK